MNEVVRSICLIIRDIARFFRKRKERKNKE